MILPPSTSKGERRTGGGDVKASPRVRHNHSVGSPSSPSIVIGYEWVWDNVLKYRSSITSMENVATLQPQLRLANPEDSSRITVQAYRSDDFPFLRVVSGNLPFFFMYKCLFEVLGFLLPLNSFQCTMLEHLNVVLSQLHANS